VGQRVGVVERWSVSSSEHANSEKRSQMSLNQDPSDFPSSLPTENSLATLEKYLSRWLGVLRRNERTSTLFVCVGIPCAAAVLLKSDAPIWLGAAGLIFSLLHVAGSSLGKHIRSRKLIKDDCAEGQRRLKAAKNQRQAR
jgi:hypothetical protein